uniref:Urease accessory protein UreD n=1 Tax=Candidatus Kentrum sp. FW TaxID=2126338 RepID=A0A450T6X3_9GAMM|nr:MAG: urease accessory protein [Candidatus Kentron sp. FW]
MARLTSTNYPHLSGLSLNFEGQTDMPVRAEQDGWKARLTFGLNRRGQRTILSRRLHYGPLVIQRPFYPEGAEICHLYLIHPPGGVVGGDELRLDVDMSPDAQALITTPASGKFYRSNGQEAGLRQNIHLSDNTSLEWMPQYNIFFSGCKARLETNISMVGSACFIGWEITALGRSASRKTFTRGIVHQRFQITRDGRLAFIENNRITGDSPALNEYWGMASSQVMGTLLAVPVHDEQLRAIREIEKTHGLEGEPASARLGVSLIEDIMVCRCLARQAEYIQRIFTGIWRVLRPGMMDRAVHEPRIWNT